MIRNLILSGFSSTPAWLIAADTKTVITVISAIVLPVLFFTIGKTIDVLLQLHLKKQRDKRNDDEGKN